MADVGKNVTKVKKGDRVVVNPNHACESCYYCRRGLPQFCEYLKTPGIKSNGGHEVSLQDAFRCAGKQGKLILAGLSSAETKVPLPSLEITKKELLIKGVFLNSNTFSRAIDLISSGKFDLQTLITNEFSLDDIKKAMKVFKKGAAVKIFIKIDD